MPFSHIPKTAAQFENDFNYITNEDPIRRKIVDLMIEVNEKVEASELRFGGENVPGGSFLWYKGLGFLRSTKRKSGAFFHPTFTMREPIRSDLISREFLDNVIDYSVNDRGGENCIYWEFYSYPQHLWVSALSQADALELFRHGWKMLGDQKYLDVCEKILNTFTVKWTDGGVKDLEWDWYLEYPLWIIDNGKNLKVVRRVLNCQQDCLILLYRFYLDTKNELALELFEKGEKELRQRLPVFIFEDGKTAYSWFQATHWDNEKKFGSYNDAYQGIHIMRTHQLWTITGDSFYRDCRDKMMEVKVKFPYVLLPHITQKFGYRTKEECCPNCELPDVRCEKCEIK